VLRAKKPKEIPEEKTPGVRWSSCLGLKELQDGCQLSRHGVLLELDIGCLNAQGNNRTFERIEPLFVARGHVEIADRSDQQFFGINLLCRDHSDAEMVLDQMTKR
jgi:hypothetical protein